MSRISTYRADRVITNPLKFSPVIAHITVILKHLNITDLYTTIATLKSDILNFRQVRPKNGRRYNMLCAWISKLACPDPSDCCPHS